MHMHLHTAVAQRILLYSSCTNMSASSISTFYTVSLAEASSGRHSSSPWFCEVSSILLELEGLRSSDPSIEHLDNSSNIGQNPQEQDLQTLP
jgi:hypothetical protein